MRKKLAIISIAAIALTLIPTQADAEPTWGGHTQQEWEAIGRLIEANPPTWGGLTAKEWEKVAELVATLPVDPIPMQSFNTVVEQIILDAANEFGADVRVTSEVTRCESGGDPKAQNSGSTASGLNQFLDSTWAAFAPRLGYDTSRATQYDARANARVAAMMIAEGGIGHWAPYSGSCSSWY